MSTDIKCGRPRTNGQPCNNKPMPGSVACSLHGGANLSAKIKAEQMLAQARLPACEALYDILENWQRATCLACGYPSGDTNLLKTIIRACQVILDRTGMGPRTTIEVIKQTDGDLDLDLCTEDELKLLDDRLDALKEIKTGIRARLDRIAYPPTIN